MRWLCKQGCLVWASAGPHPDTQPYMDGPRRRIKATPWTYALLRSVVGLLRAPADTHAHTGCCSRSCNSRVVLQRQLTIPTACSQGVLRLDCRRKRALHPHGWDPMVTSVLCCLFRAILTHSIHSIVCSNHSNSLTDAMSASFFTPVLKF